MKYQRMTTRLTPEVARNGCREYAVYLSRACGPQGLPFRRAGGIKERVEAVLRLLMGIPPLRSHRDHAEMRPGVLSGHVLTRAIVHECKI